MRLMDFISASEIATARRDAVTASVDACGGTVTIDGQNYAAAVDLGPGVLENVEGGQRDATILSASIPKTELPDAPSRLSTITHLDLAYIIATVEGTEAWAPNWEITAHR